MSLYYEAGLFLSSTVSKEGSLKSRIFKTGANLKSNPATIYALLSETAKYDTLLKEVVDNAGILALEPKLTPSLSLLLVHDHLFSKKGIAAPTNHPLRLAVERHKARLQAELTKCRLRRGFASIEDLKKHVSAQTKKAGDRSPQPRWVRVNRIKSTIPQQMSTTFSGYNQTSILADVLCASVEERLIYVDQHIPDMLALPPATDLTKTQAYRRGELVLQDKASCFPAYLLLGLSDSYEGGDILDACAAPGNKTTHLASILSQQTLTTDSARRNVRPQIFACERDRSRSETLQKMVEISGAGSAITILAQQDFLTLDPNDARFKNVTHLLLDPSCSGSGIVGRDDMPVLQLPKDPKMMKAHPAASGLKTPGRNAPKKRKRKVEPGHNSNAGQRDTPLIWESTHAESEETPRNVDLARLERLARLQTKIIEHAFCFPAAGRITYSTCSIHVEENEAVVVRALDTEVARQREWRIMKRNEQPDGMQRWPRRGLELGRDEDEDLESTRMTAAHELSREEKEACVRCQAGDEQGTMGFFVCGFVRKSTTTESNWIGGRRPGQRAIHEQHEEWGGFSDNDDSQSIH